MKVSRFVASIFVIFLLLGAFQFLKSGLFSAKGETIVDSWPSFGHDLQNTRVSSASAPKLPNLLWEFEGLFSGAEEIAVSEGRVFIGSDESNDANRPLTHNFYCLNETDGTPIWTVEINGTTNNSPAVYGDGVVVGTYTGHVYYLNKINGLKIWEIALPERIYKSSPVVSDGRVFVGGWAYGDYGSHLYCINLANGAILWNFQVRQAVYSTPAVIDGKVFVSGTGHGGGKVYCLDEITGTKVWEFTAGDHVSSSPAVVDGRVYFGSFDHKVYSLNQATGQQIWNYTCSSWIGSSPAVAYGNVFIASEDGNIYCLDAETGTDKWITHISSQITSSLSVADEMIFVTEGNIYYPLQAFNITDGSLIWKYATKLQSSSSGSSLAIADGRLFVSLFGKITCIGSPYSLSIFPTFKDNYGNMLDTSPSAWTVLFPNGSYSIVSSNSVNYPLMTNGNYSITRIIWQGIEVAPDNKPIIYFDRNFTWTPSINCKLPTQLTIDLGTSTALIGFSVSINGRLSDYKNTGLNGAQILLTYSNTGEAPWNTITTINTTADGSYSALWMPTATGTFVLKATYQGNETYPNTNSFVNLAVIAYEAKNVFSVVSNSTVSALAFNSSSNVLSFTVSGPSGTSGFANIQVAKSLVGNIANLKIYLTALT